MDAYNRHDVAAFLAQYDTVYTHETLGDSTKKWRGSPQAGYTTLTEYFKKNKLIRLDSKQQIVNGPFVVQLYEFYENDKHSPHLDMFEVRHGKIVHEWEP